MVIRSWRNCGLWLLLSVSPLLVLLWRGDNSRELLVGMTIFGLFGLQGLVAELLGVRIGDAGVSFPRRLVAALPVSVAWRRTVSPDEISRIDIAEIGGVRLSLTSAEVVDIPVPAETRVRDIVRFAREIY